VRQFFKRPGGRQGAESRLVGLDITDDFLSMVEVRQHHGKPFLKQCEQFAMTDDKPAREWLPERVSAMGLRGAPCNALLSARDYNLYLVEAPVVEESELRSAVRWKVKDLLDIPLEDAVIDIFPVPEDAFQGRSRMLYVVAAQKTRVQALIELVDRAGLELRSIDIPELVMRNITSRFADDSNGLAFMALKTTGSSLNLSRQGNLYLTRRINTQVAAEVMESGEWEGLRDRLVLEVQRSLDYYESQMGQHPVSRVTLAPRREDAGALAASLDETMAADVRVLKFAARLDHDEGIAEDRLHACMLAIGAALRDDEEAR
jgi:MSHA biogenesis protein MshI